MTSIGGRFKVQEVRGPFTYWLKLIPVPEEIQRLSTPEYRSGPTETVVQRDADGNDRSLCDMNPLCAPGEGEMVVAALNYRAKRKQREKDKKERRRQRDKSQ